ncbi:MAG TPA: amidohydrolase family protein, partial [Membranihabitans sp.]|nr:amidohydrolase family protein [Membranihabitans sp.]
TPVERVNPFENLYASVTRKASPDGKAFFPEQAMTRGEAMKSLTLWNAFATKMDPFIGSLEIGKWADFFIVDTDLLYCDSAKILEAQVLRTYVDGRMVWSQ